jgi:hypothetical protein
VTLKLFHFDRDERGEKVEAEQQPALEGGKLPVAVRMGVANPEGGPPIETSAPLTHGIPVGYQRETTAGELAAGFKRRCMNCKSFAALELGDRDVGGRVEIATMLAQKGIAARQAAEMSQVMGKCKHIGGLAHPHATCDAFREVRSGGWLRAARDKYDQIMHAADGRPEWWR